MAAMFVGFCAYFLYDGFVGYPKQKEIYERFEAFAAAQHGKSELEMFELWDKQAAAEKLPLAGTDGKAIKHMKKTDGDILQQKIFGFALVPVAAMVLFSWLKTFSRWVAVDEKGVTTSSGQSAPWESMTKLDKVRWPRKGIAFLSYNDADKQIEQKVLLDDFKFDPAATGLIIRAIEDHLTDAQILGDIRETERDKRKAEKAAAAAQPVATQPPSA